MLILNNLVEPFTNGQLLLMLLVIYIIILYLSLKFDKRIMFLTSIIWIIPISWVDNILIIIIFIILFFIHILIPLNNLRGDGNDFS